ncbi:MAG: hypothetical protein GYA20_05985 [Chloroflexi bacterium]|nr:hypothetical protein [Chloroflexota bacterium]
MNAGKTIAYIIAAILILFGVLFIWATFDASGQIGYLVVGSISVTIGLVLIFLAGRKRPGLEKQDVNVKIDLSGDVNLDTLKCKSCGGTLTSENIKLVAGAPFVTCPYCNTTYQLTEEPKW